MSKPYPVDLGYVMPAEWEPHEATWLTWPTGDHNWPGEALEKVHETYCQIIQALLPGEKIILLVKDQKVFENILDKLQLSSKLLDQLIPVYVQAVDIWIRDYGPNFLSGGKAFNNWEFNAWGNKYPWIKKDNELNDQIELLKSYQQFRPGIVLEGGSIDVNGQGTVLTTKQCLLNQNRNPRLSPKDIESYLKNYLGISQIIWLEEGLAGDDTDGHIDDIARFVGPHRIVIASEMNSSHPNYKALQENLKILEQTVDSSGNPFEIIKLPTPQTVLDDEGSQMPASYANFYIGNQVVLVPIFGDQNDNKVIEILKTCFPQREVMGVDCRLLVWGQGTLHCATQQQPRII